MEDPTFWHQFITTYGPLGLGWLAAGYLFLRFMALTDKVMNASIADTQAKMEMKAAFDKLVDKLAVMTERSDG